MESKRVSFKCDEDTYNKLESLKALLGHKRDHILVAAVNERFREVIAGIATKEGLLESTSEFELSRDKMDSKANSSYFDEICECLNLKSEDGNVSSIKTIKFEVRNISIVEN